MTAITTRAGKGSPLTNAEVDANFTGLNDGKLEKSSNLSDLANAATARTNLGLGNVNNTSDANKPISTATQTALNAKENTANKGVANGYAGLDATGKVPAAQLPSYVDDVLEYANLAAFPVTGEAGKIYVALDTNKTYRWSGSAYVYITSGAVDSVAGKTGVVTLAKADVGLGSVDNTSDANKPISTATKLALDGKAPSTHVGETGTAHGVATTLVAGFMSSADKTKLDGVAISANNYTHPSGDGNLHVPATGTTNSGKVLKAGATAGSLSWGTLAKADVGLSNVANTTDLDKPISTATQTALDGKSAVGHNHDTAYEAKNANIQSHITSTFNPHGVTKSQVGLSNVDNTADVAKPISTTQQAALNLKADLAGAAFTGASSVTANSASAALTVKQTGSGNALVVEDSASPDSTPFVIDANGGVSVGGSITQAIGNHTTTGGNLTVRSPDGVEGGEISLYNKANTAAVYSFDVDGSDHGRLFTTQNNTNLTIGQLAGTGGSVSIQTGGLSRVHVVSDGHVGIGTTPTAPSGFSRFVAIGDPDTGIGQISDGVLAVSTNNVERMRIGSNGFVSIGNHSALSKLDIGAIDNADEGAEVRLRGATNASVDWNFDVYQNAFRLFTTDKGTAANWQERLLVSHDTGTLVQTGSTAFVGHAIRSAYGSGTVTSHSYIDFRNEADVATGSIINAHNTDGSNRIDFLTTAAGARTFDRRSPALQIYGNGAVLAINPNGGLGYGTGAGGTVTQATSKSTAVTLNKPTGQITMNNAALAAGASVIFQLTNSLLTTSDMLVISPAWGGVNIDNYRVDVVGCGIGAAKLRVTNIHTASLSEALSLNFAVLKGATA